MTVTLAPELGVLDDEERRPAADRLLAARAEQVRGLLKETIALRVHRGQTPARPEEDWPDLSPRGRTRSRSRL